MKLLIFGFTSKRIAHNATSGEKMLSRCFPLTSVLLAWWRLPSLGICCNEAVALQRPPAVLLPGAQRGCLHTADQQLALSPITMQAVWRCQSAPTAGAECVKAVFE